MKILIGYDGSECAAAALDDLARAGLPGEIEVGGYGRRDLEAANGY